LFTIEIERIGMIAILEKMTVGEKLSGKT